MQDPWLPPAIAHKFVPAVPTCPLRCPTLNPQDASLLPAVHARVRLAVRLDELERKQSKAGGSAFVPVLSSGEHHLPLMCWAASLSDWFGVGSCCVCPHWTPQQMSPTGCSSRGPTPALDHFIAPLPLQAKAEKSWRQTHAEQLGIELSDEEDEEGALRSRLVCPWFL